MTVNSLADTVSGTTATLDLREAILLVNSGGTAMDSSGNSLSTAKASQIDTSQAGFGSNDAIQFDPGLAGATIVLTQGQLELSGAGGQIAIDGTSLSNPVAISGNHVSRVLQIDSGVTAAISGLVIENGTANGNGGGILDSGALTISNSTLSGNSATYNGGGIASGGTLTVSGCTVSGNTAGSSIAYGVAPFATGGGGIYSYYGTLIVDNSTISGNSSSNGYGGGGISASFGPFVVSGSTLSGNSAPGGGGGGIWGGGGTISDSTITVNTAAYGAGIRNPTGATMTITNSIISDNRTPGGAGGVSNAGTLTISGTTLSHNSAGAEGGGIASSDMLTATDCTFSDNAATIGSGMYNNGAMTVSDSTFSGNGSSYGSGGGIANAGTATVSTCTLIGNSAGNNSVRANGGGIMNTSGTMTLTSCTLVDNSASGNGGGVYVSDGGVTLSGCTLADNSAGWDGGCVYISAGDVALSGCTLFGNAVSGMSFPTVGDGSGGGIYNADRLTISGCTLSGNSAVISGGGIYSSGTLTVQSASAVYGNQAPSGANLDNLGSLSVSHSAIPTMVNQNSGVTTRDLAAADSATGLTASVDAAGRVTFHVTVLAALPGGAPPTGTVTLYDNNNNVLGTVTLGGGESAVAAGTGPFHAVYSGDGNYSGSTSAPLIQSVDPLQSNSLEAGVERFSPLVAVAALDPVLNNGLTQFREATDFVYFDGTQSTGGAADNPLHYSWDFGDGGTDSGAKPDYVYQDNRPGGYTVILTVTDEAGRTATATLNVDVINVPPIVQVAGPYLNGPSSWLEGSAGTFVASVADPSPVDTAAGFAYQWSATRDGQPYALPPDVVTNTDSLTFAPDDAGTYVVTLTATDKDGGVGSSSQEVDVPDVPPTVYIVNGSTPGAAAAGEQDPSFGHGAPVVTDISSGSHDDSMGVAVYPSSDPVNGGRILMVGRTSAAGGNLALTRYNVDGTPDSSFGTGGIVVTSFPGNATAFTLEADGKILVAGQAPSNDGGDFALARYNPDGTLDPTFGKGGVVTTDFAGGPDSAVALAVDHLGRIILAGNAFLSCRITGEDDIALARYNPDGTPDTTFGSFGVESETADVQSQTVPTNWDDPRVTLTSTGNGGMGNTVATDLAEKDSFGPLYDSALNVAVDSQNRILVIAGSALQNGIGFSQFSSLLRYNPDGRLDPSFNGSGWIGLYGGDWNGQVAVDASDRVVINALAPNQTMDIYRIAADGSLDTTFGAARTAPILPNLNLDRIAIDRSGRILIAGDQYGNVVGGPDISLIRLAPDGTPDTTFGNGGESDSAFVLAPGFDWVSGIAFQADGNIIVGGGNTSPTTDDDFAVARYLAQTVSVPQGTQLTLDSAVYDPSSVDMASLTYSWSVVTGPAGYSLPTGTATGNANFTFTPDVPGTYTIGLTVGNADSTDATTTVTRTITITPLTAQSVQQALPQNSGSANAVTIEATPNVSQDAVISAVNDLTAPQQPVTVTLDLNGGTFDDTTVSPPANVTLVINGASGTNTFVGHSPAFVVAGGNVIITNVTFTTPTGAPTILVTGGHLTLRNDVIQESTGYAEAAIAVTGSGSVDLGTAADPGNNVLNVNGAGEMVHNTTPNQVPAAGNTFTANGTPLAATQLSFTAVASSNASPVYGQAVTLTATVRADGSGSPSGRVEFLDTTTGTNLGSVPVSGGSAQLNLSSLSAGSHAIEAAYDGDATFLGSIDWLTELVAQAPLTVTVANASRAYGAANPGFTATVTGVQNNDPITVSTGTPATSSSDVGGYAINATLSDGGSGKLADYAVTITPGTLTITPADQTITWPTPAPILYGTALSGTQLDAAVSVVGPAAAGALTYSPAAGTVLGPGFHTLTVTAAATNDYNAAMASVTLQVEYAFSGFLPPLSSGLQFGLNRTIPIKFQLADTGGKAITSLSAVTSLRIAPVVNGVVGASFAPASTNNQGLQSSGGQYVFNWQTKGLAAGTYQIQLALADGTLQTRTLQLTANGGGPNAQAADGSDVGAGGTSGQLLGGELDVYVDNGNGALTDDELARIQDAITAVDAVTAPYGVTVEETTDPSQAEVTLDMAASSPVGGYADGVLGCFDPGAGQITLIQGWDWYAGSDPAQIGAGQYDFQTTLTHELGHALGLGESDDPASAMHGTLAAGTAIRTLTTADLNLPPDDGGPDPQRAAFASAGPGSGSVTEAGTAAGLAPPLEGTLNTSQPGSPGNGPATTDRRGELTNQVAVSPADGAPGTPSRRLSDRPPAGVVPLGLPAAGEGLPNLAVARVAPGSRLLAEGAAPGNDGGRDADSVPAGPSLPAESSADAPAAVTERQGGPSAAALDAYFRSVSPPEGGLISRGAAGAAGGVSAGACPIGERSVGNGAVVVALLGTLWGAGAEEPESRRSRRKRHG